MPGDVENRLTLLEEHIAFAERAGEELSTQMLQVNNRLAQLVDRLAALERRLEAQTLRDRQSEDESGIDA